MKLNRKTRGVLLRSYMLRKKSAELLRRGRSHSNMQSHWEQKLDEAKAGRSPYPDSILKMMQERRDYHDAQRRKMFRDGLAIERQFSARADRLFRAIYEEPAEDAPTWDCMREQEATDGS